MCYKDNDKKMQLCKHEQNYKNYRKCTDCSAGTRRHEGGIASNRTEEWYGEFISGLVHTARHARGDGCALGTVEVLIVYSFIINVMLIIVEFTSKENKQEIRLFSWYDLLTQVKS